MNWCLRGLVRCYVSWWRRSDLLSFRWQHKSWCFWWLLRCWVRQWQTVDALSSVWSILQCWWWQSKKITTHWTTTVLESFKSYIGGKESGVDLVLIQLFLLWCKVYEIIHFWTAVVDESEEFTAMIILHSHKGGCLLGGSCGKQCQVHTF